MLANLAAPPTDPILGMAKLFASDSDPGKIDLGIGVYHDAAGGAPVLQTVKQAEFWLAETQTSKRYLSSAGNPDFNRLIRGLIMREGHELYERSRTIQTPGGTGALRLAGDFIAKLSPEARVYIPAQTWANHHAIFPAARLDVQKYPYYNAETGKVLFDEMVAALQALRPGDAVVLHGCCQNPTGADLSPSQWISIAKLLNAKGAVPLIDLAYLGFANGLEEDAEGVRLLGSLVPEMLVASSCSKNFALYRERVGALTLIAATPSDAEAAAAHAIPLARTNWSMPPDHGAAVVAHILGTPELRIQWEAEVAVMRDRINGIRRALADRLTLRANQDFSFLAEQRGMFTQLSIGPDAVSRLRTQHHVHITGSGRLNVAGLTAGNVITVADAIALVLAN
jgi:aspartate/tyrosine/aromatic aminotransferase